MSDTLHEGAAHAHLLRRLLTLALFAGLGLAAAAVSARSASAQTLNTGSPDLVISQVYTRGGETGATFRNDYIEIFNRGNTTINLANYSIQMLVIANPQPGFPGGLIGATNRFVSSGGGGPLAPGEHRRIVLGSSGSNGVLLPGSVSPNNDFNMPGDFGRVAIVRGAAPLGQFGCPVGTDAALVDFFSYGTATCAEGPTVFPAPTATNAALRNSNGCADTDNNVTDFTSVAADPRTDSTPAPPCNLAAPANTIQFETAFAVVDESAGSAEIFVTRTGDTTGAASVQYATSNNTSDTTDRNDYATTFGTLGFAAGETRKSFRVLITDDARPEGLVENFVVGLANPSGAALGATHVMRLDLTDTDTAAAPNPIDATDFFVRQHYADFLSRVPDESGRVFWTAEIDNCGADAQCREVKRVNVSAAFFLAFEFQDTGFFAYRAHKASFPDNAAFRPRGFPVYRELWRDAQRIGKGIIVGEGDWRQQLDANKAAYMTEFVMRPEFLIRYPATQTPEQFVDTLNATAGSPLSQAERDQQVANLTAAGNTPAGRAAVLNSVVEDSDFKTAEINRAFVLMQYFGYLRRNPFSVPDSDFTGFDFWLGKLNEFNGNYIQAEMVKAFISSAEYRQRFKQ
ncbi:MAG TPA: Calx-beta domain-containing protein [Pyrinomonadaceae bacterium]